MSGRLDRVTLGQSPSGGSPRWLPPCRPRTADLPQSPVTPYRISPPNPRCHDRRLGPMDPAGTSSLSRVPPRARVKTDQERLNAYSRSGSMGNFDHFSPGLLPSLAPPEAACSSEETNASVSSAE